MYKNFLVIFTLFLTVCYLTGQNVRTRENFNGNWRLFLG